MKLPEKVLVANRGEIAARIIRTLRALGVPSVAVFQELDRGSVAVRDADEAVELHGDTPVGAYLNAEEIIAAATATGATAIHPGFGFLSENAGFAAAVADAGITFIGPPPAAIRAMGDKIESKAIAERAGMPTVPGSDGAVGDAEAALAAAEEVGYPILLKASAGGGGKGMRIARSPEECREAFELASSEALAGFGDGRVFVERYVDRPRHIEVQVLADAHGNVVHLGERECSIQRRYQKVIEEAPSSFIDPETRAEMGARAVDLAKAVGYVSAGTIEMVVDGERNFYFLEMNTRLQVEHPVTELVTGKDIVAEQLRIAAGEELGYVDDRAAAGAAQGGDRGAGAAHDAGLVDRDHFVPFGVGALADALHEDDAGVVAEDVQAAEPLLGQSHRGLPVLVAAHVEMGVDGFAARGGDLVRDLPAELVEDVAADHGRAGRREHARVRSALPSCRARDQGHFSLQRLLHLHPPSNGAEGAQYSARGSGPQRPNYVKGGWESARLDHCRQQHGPRKMEGMKALVPRGSADLRVESAPEPASEGSRSVQDA
jgi:biotin carboxylase